MIFSLVPPDFSTKKEIANKPITAAVPVNPVTKKGRDWLLDDFIFGIEIGGYYITQQSSYDRLDPRFQS